MIIFILGCTRQHHQKFSPLLDKFVPTKLPIDSIPSINTPDTLSVKFFNDLVWNLQPKEKQDGKVILAKPKIFKDGKLLEMSGFGKVDEEPTNYQTADGKQGKFFAKVYPVARINLHKNFISLIVKTYNLEMGYYDIYNFTKDGKRLSAIPLFTYVHDKMLEDKIDHVVTHSSILKDGSIVWSEYNRGLTTNRVYRLRDDGYFEIIKEEKIGKFEY